MEILVLAGVLLTGLLFVLRQKPSLNHQELALQAMDVGELSQAQHHWDALRHSSSLADRTLLQTAELGLSVVARRRGDLDAALRHTQEAIALGNAGLVPDMERAFPHLVHVLIAYGQLQAATETLADVKTDSPTVTYLRALVSYYQGDIAGVERVLTALPSPVSQVIAGEITLLRARVALQQQHPKVALELLSVQKAEEGRRHGVLVEALCLEAFVQQGTDVVGPLVVRLLERAAAFAEDQDVQAAVWRAVAEARLVLHQYQPAVEAFERAITITPHRVQVPELLLRLAACQEMQGHFELARAALQRAANVDVEGNACAIARSHLTRNEPMPKQPFSPDAFRGTADDYARYRVPYPTTLIEDLLRRSGASGTGRLLDLACGPGRSTFPLAKAFTEIWAIDLEPEMIDVAKSTASQLGITSIRWFVGSAEELDAPETSFSLVTVGDAFHRLDQRVVTERALRWLQPSGSLVVLGVRSQAADWEPWHHAVAQVVHKWTGKMASTGGVATGPGQSTDDIEQALRSGGFDAVCSYDFDEPYVWSPETIVGNLYSLSFCSKRVLGPRADAFGAEVKAALLAHDPAGVYRETIRFGYTIGRKRNEVPTP